MMKYLGQSLKLKVLLFLVAMVFFASCHQHTVELACQQALNNKAVAEDSGGIFITVENFINQPHRTVAPDQLDQLTGYELILSGTSGRMDLPERQLTLSNGTVTIEDVPEGLWELTLKARATRATAVNGASAGATILEGKAVAQVDGDGMTPVKFTLRPVEAGNGTLLLTINIDQGNVDSQLNIRNGIEKTHIRLYDKKTNALVPNDPDNFYSGRLNRTSYPFPASRTPLSLPAGEYELRVEFRLWDEISAVWKEDIIIEPGRLTNGTITVPHILKTPTQTSWRQPAFSNVSSLDSGLFEATLDWDTTNTATSSSVTSYEIQLKKLPADDTRTRNVSSEGQFDAINGDLIIINGDPNSPHHFSNYMGTYPVALAEGITTFDRTASSLKLLLAGGRYVYRLKTIGDSGRQLWTYGTNANVLLPLPATPTIPTTYFITGRYSSTQYNATVSWNPVDYATDYEIQTRTFENTKPDPAAISGYLNDQTFPTTASAGGTWITRNASYFYRDLQDSRSYLVRVRARNSTGNSPWFYYPKLLTKDGPWPQ